jgi:hypothetical protein
MLVAVVEPQNPDKLPAQAVMVVVEMEKQVLELLMEMARQTQAAEVVVWELTIKLREQAVLVLSLFVTQVLNAAQAVQLHQQVATPIIHSHLLGHTQHEQH